MVRIVCRPTVRSCMISIHAPADAILALVGKGEHPRNSETGHYGTGATTCEILRRLAQQKKVKALH